MSVFLISSGAGLPSDPAGFRIRSLALACGLMAFGLAACGGGGGDGGGDGGDDPEACETRHSSGTCGGFSGTATDTDFTLTGGEVSGDVTGGDGNEANAFMLNGGTVTGNVESGGGNDAITLGGAEVAGHVDAGADSDTIRLSGGTWDSYNGGEAPLSPAAETIYGGSGADSLFVSGGEIGDIIGSDSSADSLEVADDGVLAGQLLAGRSLAGRSYSETLVFSGGSVNGNVRAGGGNDLIVLGLLSDDGVQQTTFAASSYVDGGAGNDEIILQAGEWAGYDGGAAGSTARTIYGGAGADSLLIAGDATIGDVVGSDDSTGNTVSLTTLQDNAGLLGGNYHEILSFFGGEVTGNVRAGGGNDLIVLGVMEGTTPLTTTFGDDSYVDGGEGADTIALGAGTWAGYNGGAAPDTNPIARTIYGGLGIDTFILGIRTTIEGNVIGEDGERDVFRLFGDVRGYVDAGSGDDAITLSDGTWDSYDGGVSADVDGTVYGGGGADALILDGAKITGNILGEDDSDDVFMFTRGSGDHDSVGRGGWAGYVDARGGDDAITLGFGGWWDSYNGGEAPDAPAARTVYGGAGADTFILDGAIIRNGITGDDEDETFMLISGTLTGYMENEFSTPDAGLDGGGGADRITLAGLNLTSTYVTGGEGDDIITIGTGTDILIYHGDEFGQTGRSPRQSVYGGGGEDTLILDGGTILTINGERGGTYMLRSGEAASLNALGGATVIIGEAGMTGPRITGQLAWQEDSVVTLASGSLAFIRAFADSLTIGVTAGAGVIDFTDGFELGYIDMDTGDDTLTMNIGTWASYSGGAFVHAPSPSASPDEDGALYGGLGADTLILQGATITGNIIGDGEADVFTLLSGNVGSETYVDGGGGADMITLGFGTWDSYDGGDRGGDTTATKIWGGAGADTLILQGGTISGNIIGEDGADVFTLISGNVGSETYVDGGGDADMITLGFGTWDSYSGGDRGGDTTATKIWGGAGADTFILDGATITGNIIGDGEADVFTLISGNVGSETYVDGGGGADMITLGFGTWDSYSGGAAPATPDGGTVYGGADTDTLILQGGTISGNIIGEDGADVFTLLSGNVEAKPTWTGAAARI